MNKQTPEIHIGTSGWSYKHWAGLFYPDDVKPAKYLEYYITQFDCVELNSSFYHLPKPSTAEGWKERTPANFRFCPKLSRFITHRLKLNQPEEALQNFFEVVNVMHERLGPVLIQLPPSLKYDHGKVNGFLNLLNLNFEDYRFAIEIRNKSWINDDFFGLLSEHDVAFVIADSGKRYPYHEAVTTDFVYLRLHGNTQLYASDYTGYELKHYAEKINHWRNQRKEVWVFFNNDFQGFAVKNARKLLEFIQPETKKSWTSFP